MVDDVLKSLQKLATIHRKKIKIPLIAITGTNGKTTTKELIGSVLKSKFDVLITKGNLNNHIGVPLTILKIQKRHQIAVIEMGASKKGDIKELAEIALPNYGIITNIGKAHLEGFGNIETIRKTKLELFWFSKFEFCFVSACDSLTPPRRRPPPAPTRPICTWPRARRRPGGPQTGRRPRKPRGRGTRR